MGTPNKATIEKQLRQAQETHQALTGARQKLAKDVLDDFMQLTAGMAAFYQPRAPDQPPNPNQNEAKFWDCVAMVRDFAKALAPYQSPTFKAIAVYAPPDQTKPSQLMLPADGNVVSIDDPQALQRVYKNRIQKVG